MAAFINKFKSPYAIGPVPSLSGHANAYRWRSLPRLHRHRASKPQGGSERVLPWQVTMDQLIFASLPTPTIGRKWATSFFGLVTNTLNVKNKRLSLYLQPMIPPKRFDIFPPNWGMLRRSRCVQIFLLNDNEWRYYRINIGLCTAALSFVWCPCMAINVSVQYNGEFLRDIILLTQGYYHHRGTHLNAMKRFCICSL